MTFPKAILITEERAMPSAPVGIPTTLPQSQCFLYNCSSFIIVHLGFRSVRHQFFNVFKDHEAISFIIYSNSKSRLFFFSRVWFFAAKLSFKAFKRSVSKCTVVHELSLLIFLEPPLKCSIGCKNGFIVLTEKLLICA